jgi:hypothetical protein
MSSSPTLSSISLIYEAFAKLALKAKFDDFDVGSIFRKLTYPFGHRRFAKNPNPTLKAQIWPQMEFWKSLLYSIKLKVKILASVKAPAVERSQKA